MKIPPRKVRIAILLTIAIVAAFVAWRTNWGRPEAKPCVAGRHEQKDAQGTVISITRTTCA